MKKKLILNVGLPRSGTTSLHGIMSKASKVTTPLHQKEIKYFLRENVHFQEYINLFENSESSVFFESSPPYTVLGVEAFKSILNKVKEMKFEDYLIVFSVRPLAERAFSAYWHSIQKHYSIFGSSWKVKDTSSVNRFNSIYTKSFEKAVCDQPESFKPDLAKFIEMAIESFGKDSVAVLPLINFEKTIRYLEKRFSLIGLSNIRHRTKGGDAPFYLKEGEHPIYNSNEKLIVPSGAICLVNGPNSEFLYESDYPIERIYKSFKNWTYEASSKKLRDLFESYLVAQKDKLLNVHNDVIIGMSVNEFVDYISGIKTIQKSYSRIPKIHS